MTISNRYNLIKQLGEGGFGEVWLAKDQTSNRQVALKLYKTTGSGHKELVREFNQVYGLDSVNLVKAYHVDRDETQGISYLVMDYCRYGSLAQFIGRLNEQEMWRCIRDIASGLVVLSEHTVFDEKQQREIAAPVVHQDLKPANILIRKHDKDGHNVYAIADFGISKTSVSQKSGSSVFVSAGTLAYMGPERFFPNYRPRVESDIWSIGAMLYELVEGKTPFPTMDTLSGGNWLNQEGVELPKIENRDISSNLRNLIYSCMGKEPVKRPTAKQLYEKASAKLSSLEKNFHDDTFTQPTEPLHNEKINVDRAATTWGVRMDGNTLVPFVDGTEYGYEMVYVSGGTFKMGVQKDDPSSDNYDPEALSDESPVHRVTVNSFYIGQTEVTQALWKAVMCSNPSRFRGNDRPVENVSWNDCQEFIKRLNQLTGKTFRLPTEAEWEYAARGGNKSKGYKYAGSNNIGDVAWYKENSGDSTHPVKGKQANELGLYDMTGNVWELCSDWHSSSYYGSSSQMNPSGPFYGSDRVLRGGSWCTDARCCRVSTRSLSDPDRRYADNGFRLVIVP